MTIECPTCGTTAATIIDDNGVVDPAEGDRVEFYECPDGHTFKIVLKS